MNIKPVELTEVEKVSSNVYEAIIASAKRARQISSERKIELSAISSTVPEEKTDEEAEDIINPGQAKISIEFEQRIKPHLAALNELLEKKIPYHYKTEAGKKGSSKEKSSNK